MMPRTTLCKLGRRTSRITRRLALLARAGSRTHIVDFAHFPVELGLATPGPNMSVGALEMRTLDSLSRTVPVFS